MPGRLVVSIPREVIVTYNHYETCCHAQDPAKQSRRPGATYDISFPFDTGFLKEKNIVLKKVRDYQFFGFKSVKIKQENDKFVQKTLSKEARYGDSTGHRNIRVNATVTLTLFIHLWDNNGGRSMHMNCQSGSLGWL